MKAIDILFLVQCETQISYSSMLGSKETPVLFSRYVAIVMMYEEGISHVDIAKVFEMDRTNVYYSLKSISSLLETNKQFKNMYLSCIRRMAEMEDAA